jgi:low affinity Fe/Cu permease
VSVIIPPLGIAMNKEGPVLASANRHSGGDTGKTGASGDWFARMAHASAHWAGKPVTFLICFALVLVWAVTGPLFDYSDTWQLVINTSTTIITFLKVFLIQNTQNRDTMAIQVKLAELIRTMQGARNQLATAEDLSEQELEALHQRYCELAEHALERLEGRQSKKEGE